MMTNNAANGANEMTDATFTPFGIQSEIQAVMVWAAKAAAEQVDLAHHWGETPDNCVGEGLWQSYRADFPREKHDAMGIAELAIAVLGQTYKNTVDLLDAKARQAIKLAGTVEADGTVKIDQTPELSGNGNAA